MSQSGAQSEDRRGSVRGCLLFAVAACGLAGCIGKIHHPPRDRPAVDEPPPAARAAVRAVVPPDTSRIELTPVRETPRYRIHDLRMASGGRNNQPGNQVVGSYMRSKLPGRHPLVLVLPVWGRSDYPPNATAHRLARQGDLHLLVLEGEEALFDWRALREVPSAAALAAEMQRSADAFMATVSDVRRLVGWARERSEVDGARIGVVGFSISAILGSVVMGLDGRVSRGAFVMGGAHLDEIFSGCNKRPGRVREGILERLGWSTEEFRRAIEPIVEPLDPVHYVDGVDPSAVLLIDAQRDRCISERGRHDLWAAFGYPERISLDAAHRRSFLSMTFLDGFWTVRRIADFFRWPADDGAGGAVAAAGSGGR